MGWRGGGPNTEKEAPRFKTFSDHKELLLNLPWSIANTGIEQFFKGTGSESRTEDQWGVPSGLGGDRIHCKVIGESMWFPWFTLPLWELILLIAIMWYRLMISWTVLKLMWKQCSCHSTQIVNNCTSCWHEKEILCDTSVLRSPIWSSIYRHRSIRRIPS